MNTDGRPESVRQDVLFHVTGQVATVLLNRPDSRNAINGNVARALRWIIDEIDQSPPAGRSRVWVLRAGSLVNLS